MAKVQKFEDGLKLSIHGKIVGFLLQDMDLMVRTDMAIKTEVDNAWNIRVAGVKDKRKGANLLILARERSRGLPLYEGFRDRATPIKATARVDHPKVGDISGRLASQCREHVSIATSLHT